ncbi:MAG TPA: 4Fe-4S binding protein, partial [Candidatus Blautia excrementipullorum]|nr:4Fe-4S binding protein [Candidatus Blautia excrementipullorum]
GRPQTRVIDMMLWDEAGVYFLTAKGKEFYRQLMEQQYIALSATKDKRSVSLRGKIRNIGAKNLDEIFLKNTYMQKIYPGDTKAALEVFQIYEAEGEYFDISDPSHVVRDPFVIGKVQVKPGGYFVGQGCIGCRLCYSVCPQKCIDISKKPVVIDPNHCLHCGRCAEICPRQIIEKRL